MNDPSIAVLLIEHDVKTAQLFGGTWACAASPTFVITHVGSLDSALRLLQEAGFDVIAVDLGLRDEQGLDALARIHERASQTPIIVLTDAKDEGLGLEAVRCGAQDYLVKGQFDGGLLARVMQCAVERKRAEGDLRKREERWRTYIDTANDWMFTLDPAGTITWANQAVYTATGYQPGELLGHNVLEAIAPESYAAAAEAVDHILREENVEEAVVEVIGKGGRRLTVEIRGRMLYEADKFAGTFHIARDVTRRKRAEDALRESENRYRQLFDAESDSVFMIENETGRILEANAAAEALYGFSRQELLGMRNTDLSAEPQETRRVTQVSPIAPDHVVDIPLRFHRKKDGTVFPVEITGRFFMWQGRPVHIAAIRDISQRRQVEEALRENESRLRAILDSIQTGVLILDPETHVIADVNPAGASLIGAPRDAIIGSPCHKFVCPAEAGRCPITDLGLALEHAERSLLTVDGRELPIIKSVCRIMLGGRPHLLETFIDITERKQAEAQLQASLREKEMLLKEIHHRVKNNLQVVSSLLGLQADSVADAQVRQMFQDSISRIRAMSLIHERLYSTRDLASIDAGEYVRDLVAHLFSLYANPARMVRSYIGVDDLALGIDTAIPCGLLLTELVSNVLKHAYPPDWGRQGRIDIELRAAREGWLTLSVGDDGVGLPADLDLRQPGSLGLQLVNMLVRQIRGTVELDRSKGTTFRITFPHSVC